MSLTFKGSYSFIFTFASHLHRSTLNDNIFFFKSRSYFEGLHCPGKEIGSHKSCFPWQKWLKNREVYPYTFKTHSSKYEAALNRFLSSYPSFSLTPYLESFTPTFGLGTPVFPRISSNLHCGTPTFSRRCLWDSYFQNPNENPVISISSLQNLPCPSSEWQPH